MLKGENKKIGDKLQLFSCEIGQCGKSSIPIFQEFFASIEKTFILEERLTNKQ